MAPFGDSVHVRRGTLKDYLPQILSEYSQTPTLFFLDPFGLKGLAAHQVADCLAGEANEALVLFNDPGAERLAGAAEGQLSGRQGPGAYSLFDQLDDPMWTNDDENAPAWSDGGACREILETAFGGGSWEQAVHGCPSGPARRTALINAYEGLLQTLGTTFTTQIPVRNRAGQREYTLVHASKSPSGRVAIKEATIGALNACSLPGRVKDILRLELEADLGPVEALLCEQFAGQEVQWTGRKVTNIRKFILGHSAVFPHQLGAMRTRLFRFKVPGRGPVRFLFSEPLKEI